MSGAANQAANAMFQIEAAGGESFPITEMALNMSKTLGHLVTNLGYNEEAHREPIPVSSVTAPILKKVIEWCEHHKEDPKMTVEEENRPRNIEVPEWDAKFLVMDNDELFDLICAANFLDIRGLLDVSCKTVANMAKGKSPEELRQIFDIKTDEEDEAEERRLAEEQGSA